METLLLEEVPIISEDTVSAYPSSRVGNAASTERFDAIYRQVHPEVLRFVARRLIPPNYARAEEIAHDAFTKLWLRRDSLPHEIGEIRAWLFTVARNYLIKSNMQGFRSRDLSVQISNAAFEFIPEPIDSVGNRALGIDLATAWRHLTPAEQEVISLTYWDELTSVEAGQVLGISGPGLSLTPPPSPAKAKEITKYIVFIPHRDAISICHSVLGAKGDTVIESRKLKHDFELIIRRYRFCDFVQNDLYQRN